MRTLISLILLLATLPSLVAAGETDPIRAGYDLYYRGALAGAYRHFRALSEKHPNNVAAAYGVLSALYARDLTEEALEEEFEQRTKKLIALAKLHYDNNPQDREALFYLAQAYGLRAGYRFQRRKSLLGAARDAARSKKYSMTFVKQNPERKDALIALGLNNYYSDIAPSALKVIRSLLLIPGGDRRLGLQQLERAAREGEIWPPQAKLELVQIYGWLEGRVEEALQLAEELHQQYPENPAISLRLARLYAGPVLEDYARAAAEYSSVLKQAEANHPHYPAAVRYQALLGLADVKAKQWELQEAIALLHPVIDSKETSPSWAVPKSLLARARFRALLNDSRAEEDNRRVLQNPGWEKWHAEARKQLTWIRARRKSSEAVRFAELIPGNRLMAQKRRRLARKFFEQQQRAHPNDWQVRFRLAQLSFAQGRFVSARKEFRKILRRGRRLPAWLKADTRLFLARLHDLHGERKQALRLYEDIVDDYEEESAALAARIGLLTPYRRIQLAAR